MKTFIHILQNRLSNKYPDIEFGFYVSRRSRYVHMGLDKSILSYEERYDITSDIMQIWSEKKQDDRFTIVKPHLINSTKWRFDYIIFEKNNYYKEWILIFIDKKCLRK